VLWQVFEIKKHDVLLNKLPVKASGWKRRTRKEEQLARPRLTLKAP
jgi:hypothetical protein